ncbi:uncharacterized protein LOC126678659 isoform X2 [Mercurialis annua]|uniref:uncharacterized protein LOC126673949 isoform X2 n=2 Tax=Mercurialis annua TaxID=3986 RepID=UPI00215F1B24|nr:uncharacterized protein LOC126673949 isoform X2 [Mercurialis annua]XP_050226960.1 uncharacterized protein LOC126678659 isoform X2 [Mercurialis annua]
MKVQHIIQLNTQPLSENPRLIFFLTSLPIDLHSQDTTTMEGQAKQVVCDCGIPCRMQISSTERNPGRRFYGCSKRNMTMVRNLKSEVNGMTEERNKALLELVHAHTQVAAKTDELEQLNEAFEGLKESIEMYHEENVLMIQDSGLQLMEINTLKKHVKLMEVKCSDMERKNKIMRLGFFVAFTIAGCSLSVACLKKK